MSLVYEMDYPLGKRSMSMDIKIYKEVYLFREKRHELKLINRTNRSYINNYNKFLQQAF